MRAWQQSPKPSQMSSTPSQGHGHGLLSSQIDPMRHHVTARIHPRHKTSLDRIRGDPWGVEATPLQNAETYMLLRPSMDPQLNTLGGVSLKRNRRDSRKMYQLRCVTHKLWIYIYIYIYKPNLDVSTNLPYQTDSIGKQYKSTSDREHGHARISINIVAAQEIQ